MAPTRKYLHLVPFFEPDLWNDLRAGREGVPRSAIARYTQFARAAEEAKLDALFKADFLGFNKFHIKHDPTMLTEPLAVASALSSVTEHIGLVVTASTSFFEPYNIARQIATLNYISGGRAGWNVVTSYNGEVNFGPATFGTPEERYARATEFVEVVLKLWEGWEPDAISYRPDGTVTVDPLRIHDTNHVGEHFSVEEALDVSRVVEDLPVIFQAGASEAGIRFAARFGEAIFVAAPDLAHAHEYYERVKGLVVENGRHPDSLRVLPGVRIYLGDTEEEAQEEYREIFHHESFYEERRKFVKREGPAIDLDGLDLDDVIPTERIPSRETMLAAQRRVSRGLLLHDILIGTPGITVRRFLQRLHGGGHLLGIGTPDQVASMLAEWFTTRASDGFTLQGGNSFARFAGEVVPLLQERGIVREDYEGQTLRANLGLEAYPSGVYGAA
jgi:FMN-dependent oxidoreductase (nitrilotriacetate monooxygenase family)